MKTVKETEMGNTLEIRLPLAIQQTDGVWTKDVVLAEMTGEEEDILVDMQRAPGNKGALLKPLPYRYTEILSRCTVSIGNESRDKGDRFSNPNYFTPHWTRAFTNDRAFALIRLRQLSLGDEYTFVERCPECDKVIRATLDLSSLEVKSVDIDVISADDGQFVHTLPSGMTVKWRILRGQDEQVIDEIREGRKSDIISALLFTRLVAINGEKPRFEDLRRMTSKERLALRHGFDEIEGGIDTEAEITCDNPSCGMEFKRSFTPGRPDFFFPSEIPSDLKGTSSA